MKNNLPENNTDNDLSHLDQQDSTAVFKKLLKWRFWAKVFVRFRQHQGTDAVAILAFTTLLGIVPVLAVMLSLFSVSTYFDSFETIVMQHVVHNLMPDSQPVIEEYLMMFSMQAVSLKGPALVVMLFTTLMLLWKIDQKLNGLWPHGLKRKWWVSILHYLGVSLLGPLLLGLSLVTSSYVLALPFLAETTPWLEKLTFGIRLLPLIFSLLGFVLLYKLVPVAYVPVKAAFVSGVFATIQLELLKAGFGLYIKWFPTYDLIYGAFASVPLFLLWLYLVWFIVIWNGALVVTLTQYMTSSQQTSPPFIKPIKQVKKQDKVEP
ncbi:YihY family inner membrane protein [Thiomicrorhabdus arctica]|jgi:membrane protein|uniref:YihY family inner membrane protein n=1 Tax=Thiomicrorhabdus arctica TaxID=131540 RepID=UPI00037266CB|nr:YihY family inner membrane protein [Thiomicrorhabdus arctica]